MNDPLSQHLYVYVANNPILYVDPSGHLKICSEEKVQGNTRAYEIIDNIFMGRYFGTTYGEEAIDWYVQQIVEKENDTKWYELAPYYAGAGFSSLWTENTWYLTSAVLAVGYIEGPKIVAYYTAQEATRKTLVKAPIRLMMRRNY